MLHQVCSRVLKLRDEVLRIPYKRASRKTISAYLREHVDDVRINVGSGSNMLHGWLNGELWPVRGSVYINAEERLEFEDNSVRLINAEHLIEHLKYDAGRDFIKECWRVLGINGVLRLTTPNLEMLMQLYFGDGDVQRHVLLSHHKEHYNATVGGMCEWFNDHMRLWGHQFVYDEEKLMAVLQDAGFSRLVRCEFGKSQLAELQGIEFHDEGVVWMQSAYVSIIEAYK